MVNPPAEGTDSYKLYCKERDEQLASLKRRATKLTTALEVGYAQEIIECFYSLFLQIFIRFKFSLII